MNEEVEEKNRLEIRKLRKEGRYKEALERLISLYRGSFEHVSSGSDASSYLELSEWIKIAHEYPPAYQELSEIRAAKTRSILEGSKDRRAFADVEIINRAFNEVQETINLFRKIEDSNPEYAASLSGMLFDSLVDLEEYCWARKYIASPEMDFARLERNFNDSKKLLKDDYPNLSEEVRAIAEGVFEAVLVESVKRMIAVFEHTGEIDEAVKIRRSAISLVGRELAI